MWRQFQPDLSTWVTYPGSRDPRAGGQVQAVKMKGLGRAAAEDGLTEVLLQSCHDNISQIPLASGQNHHAFNYPHVTSKVTQVNDNTDSAQPLQQLIYTLRNVRVWNTQVLADLLEITSSTDPSPLSVLKRNLTEEVWCIQNYAGAV